MTDLDRMQRQQRDLSQQIALMRTRVELHRTTYGSSAPELLADLEAQSEELAVADEELQVQVEELAWLTGERAADQRRHRELLDAAPDAFYVLDLHGVVVDANLAASSLVEVGPRYLPGKPMAAMVHRDDVARFRQFVLEVPQHKRREVELRLRDRHDGSTNVVLFAVLAHDGKRILVVARPTTERDTTEAARAELLELLAQERRMRVELEASSRAKDHFLAVLAHDMRSPVMAIDGWTSVLRLSELSPEGRERALSTIEHCAQAQSGLVSELFELSRLGAHKVRLDLGLFALGEAARRSVESVGPSAHVKGVTLELEVAPELPPVMADALRMDRVITNLIGNAIKFTPEGGRVAVDVRRAGGHVELRVRDTGCGIAPGELERMFDCFSQGESVQGGNAGVGLGLYIARQIADLHHGSVTAHSDGLGQGATFCLRLPAFRAPALMPPRSTSAPRANDSTALESLRILLLEDDPIARADLAGYLQSRGAEVYLAESVDEALEAYDDFEPHVLISDMDGLDDSDRLVRGVGTARKGVAVAVASRPELVARAKDAGFDVQLTKPIDPEHLVRAVAQSRLTRTR